MSGLVIGLQNRAQRFESASDLLRRIVNWQFLLVNDFVFQLIVLNPLK